MHRITQEDGHPRAAFHQLKLHRHRPHLDLFRYLRSPQAMKKGTPKTQTN
ncbi:hypothetical protein RSSM_06524 [Rhodopirellula sallentina SM41]|uniref:Uncharacterized protein n=1 Tax=Rhodopirellula sallentina SM41 TaxID=1263870 RepID=M5U2F3_9BACT|nr:hypothetical protein RSSM_06524 [Rhodopirellula sallentina SM41]